jgi:hypothetical protein
MGRTMLTGAEPATEASAIEEVRHALAPYTGSDGVRMGAAIWLVTARA